MRFARAVRAGFGAGARVTRHGSAPRRRLEPALCTVASRRRVAADCRRHAARRGPLLARIGRARRRRGRGRAAVRQRRAVACGPWLPRARAVCSTARARTVCFSSRISATRRCGRPSTPIRRARSSSSGEAVDLLARLQVAGAREPGSGVRRLRPALRRHPGAGGARALRRPRDRDATRRRPRRRRSARTCCRPSRRWSSRSSRGRSPSRIATTWRGTSTSATDASCMIDFQDALIAPDAFDLAQLLTDRSTIQRVDPELARRLVARFREAMAPCGPAARRRLRGAVRPVRAAARPQGDRTLLLPRGCDAEAPATWPICLRCTTVARHAFAGSPISPPVRRRIARWVARAGRRRMIRRAMVLAAGRGTRLAPLTDTTAEAAHAGGRAADDRTHRSSSCAAAESTRWSSTCITSDISSSATIGDGARFGLRVRYSWEPDDPRHRRRHQARRAAARRRAVRRRQRRQPAGAVACATSSTPIGTRGGIVTMVVRPEPDAARLGADRARRRRPGATDRRPSRRASEWPPSRPFMFPGLHVFEPPGLRLHATRASLSASPGTTYPAMLTAGEPILRLRDTGPLAHHRHPRRAGCGRPDDGPGPVPILIENRERIAWTSPDPFPILHHGVARRTCGIPVLTERITSYYRAETLRKPW